MLGYDLRIVLRSLRRERAYALINTFSLALAVACCIVLFIYIRNELTYDRHNAEYDRIWRVVNILQTNGRSDRLAYTSQVMAPLFVKEYPQVGEFVRFRNLTIARNAFRHEETSIYWDNVRIADENVFDVFTHRVIYGDLEGALEDPSSIVVSESFARSYFGDRNPVGETISTDTFTYKITAVFEDLPANSHLKYSALISMHRLVAFGIDDSSISPQQLYNPTCYTYFKLAPNVDGKTFQVWLNEFADKYNRDAGQGVGSFMTVVAQPLTRIHFDSGFRFDQPTGDIFYVYAFIAVSVFLIVVACINYTNLATARATKRAAEVGIQRLLGASRLQLAVRFLSEPVAYSLAAVLMGLLVLKSVEALTPFSLLFSDGSALSLFADPEGLAWIILGGLLIGLLAGAYPAVYLSSIPPLAALGSADGAEASRPTLRQVLVFVQLFVSIAAITSTLLMARQIQYVMSQPLGFEHENRLAITLRGVDVVRKIPVIRAELTKRPEILGVTRTSFEPGDEISIRLARVETSEGQMELTTMNEMVVDEEFVHVMEIDVLEGRDFSQRLLTDTGTSILVNETLTKQVGWNDAIGKRVGSDGRVVGVIADFNFDSLRESIGPMVLRLFPADDPGDVPLLLQNLVSRLLIVHIADERKRETLAYIASVISKFDPNHPFEYRFLDDLVEEQYQTENRLIKLTGVFSIVCILISCMGLFGLTAFTTARRAKEIAIRKILGCSTLGIVMQFSKGLVVSIIAAGALASAASLLAIKDWLSAFAYRADVESGIFVVATLMVAFVGFCTVALQAARAARNNLAETLSYE